MAEILHLPTYEYNVARMFTQLREIVKQNGARFVEASRYNRDIFKEQSKSVYIVNRSLEERVKEPRLSDSGNIRLIDNFPQVVTNMSHLEFVIDGMFYGISLHSMNPFCGEIVYLKTPVLHGDKIYDACYELLCDVWPNFPLVTEYQTTQKDLGFIASFLLDKLMEANETKDIPTKSVRVQNMFDGGFHTEKIRPTMNLFNR